MVTVEQIIEYFERTLAEYQLAGDTAGLRRLQTAAGVIMGASQANRDMDTAYRFRILAAHAANKLEELSKEA